jgi:hypothetical protein
LLPFSQALRRPGFLGVFHIDSDPMGSVRNFA